MAYRIRTIGAATAALALFLSTGSAQAASRKSEPANRGVESVHQPIVERTDYVLDLQAGPRGLAFGEQQRLSGWFDGLGLGYGDTIMLDDPMGSRAGSVRDGVSAVVSRYGMLVSRDAPPVTVGRPVPGTIRVVVSRATAHVEGCSDWSHANNEYSGGTASNYGCATAENLAAMIANPEDLVHGQEGNHSSDAMLSVKAIKAFRDAPATGSGALKSETTGGK